MSKGDLREGATFYAQGGIAAVLDEADSIESHVQDTLTAGVGLCHRDVVEHTVAHSAEAVTRLVSQGVPFTTRNNAERQTGTEPVPAEQDLSSLHLTQEGGHSHRRIIHATDAAGHWQCSKPCSSGQKEHPSITLPDRAVPLWIW